MASATSTETMEEETVEIRRNFTGHANRYRPRFRDNYPRPPPEERSFDWFGFDFWNRDEEETDKDKDNKFKIDLNKHQNRKDHNTYMYEAKNLIVRRGQAFVITIQLGSIKFDPDLDRFVLVFSTGSNPLVKNGTLVKINVAKDRHSLEKNGIQTWSAYIASTSHSSVHMHVEPPPKAIVSTYRLTVRLISKDENLKDKIIAVKEYEDIFVLFNPWCRDDHVHVEDKAERQEYVLRDSGRMFVGDHNSVFPRPWRYGQFDKESLEAAFHLLDRSRLNKQGHGNVVQVCRTLTAQLNSKDNDGVLVGNWSGNYPGGLSPSAWSGSAAILQKYIQSKRPVKYGQCWVFSGLLTTVCRALGIPCRSTTTFLSGIDRDLSMTIDSYVDEQLRPLYGMDDSNWNFHVWNEGWFKRPDLPAGYDGWQAIDSCPQDSMVSEGLHCCGPAPLRAIKEGNLHLGYDANFVFAEVNGDKLTWMVRRDGEAVPLRRYSEFNYIGKKISTKAVGRNKRSDITELYKHPEGSREEREAVERASYFSPKKAELLKFYDDDMPTDVDFLYTGETKPNADLALAVEMLNNSGSTRSIDITMRAAASYYTGVTGEEVAVSAKEVNLNRGQSKKLHWTIPADFYLNVIDEDATLRIWITGKVKETVQLYFKTESFTIDKPDLLVKLNKSRVRVGEALEVTVVFDNHFATKLTQGVLHIEGLSSNKSVRVPLHRSVQQGQRVEEKVTITPSYPAETEIVASLNFRQLTGIFGAAEVNIIE